MRNGEDSLDALEMSELERGDGGGAGTRASVGERGEGFWLNWASPTAQPATSTGYPTDPFHPKPDDGSGTSMVRYTPPLHRDASRPTLANLDGTVGTAMVAMGPHLGGADVEFVDSTESDMDPSDSEGISFDVSVYDEDQEETGEGGDDRVGQMRAVFDTIDRNHDGSINVRELLMALRKHPGVAEFMHMPAHVRQVGGTRETFEEMFQAIDKDGSRDVTWAEFEAYFDNNSHAALEEKRNDVLALTGPHVPSPLATAVVADFE